jgi:NADH dehydrogenase/NADH:ubiquinone oxidoreductase subunit G
MNLIKVKINEREILVDKNLTIMQACNMANVEIPHFCYHENLSIAGNCRMCLVEVNYTTKLQVSCAVNVVSDLKVITNSYRLTKARESILEFLLVNHPLDCPICDQGGECDLQDLSNIFGIDRGRALNYKKKAIEDIEESPIIKTIMTRCIYCTRCVRFLQEINSEYSLGTVGRGSKMEVHTYVKNGLLGELTGNIIDLCPVGALTAKPMSFEGRA